MRKFELSAEYVKPFFLFSEIRELAIYSDNSVTLNLKLHLIMMCKFELNEGCVKSFIASGELME